MSKQTSNKFSPGGAMALNHAATALLLAPESQSFPDNVVAGFRSAACFGDQGAPAVLQLVREKVSRNPIGLQEPAATFSGRPR